MTRVMLTVSRSTERPGGLAATWSLRPVSREAYFTGWTLFRCSEEAYLLKVGLLDEVEIGFDLEDAMVEPRHRAQWMAAWSTWWKELDRAGL